MAIELSGITWILTYNCNLCCDHCFFDVKGDAKTLDPALVGSALSSLRGDPVGWQHVSGGEPLIRPDALHAVVDAIRGYGTNQIGIATNGFWGSSTERAMATVAALKRHGVTGVCISADGFHGVEFETIRNACAAVADHEMGGHSWVVSCDAEHASEIGSFGLPVAQVDIRNIGKGRGLAELTDGITDAPCTQLCCCMGETTPFEPKMVWIDPYGNVMICYGLIIGNLHDRSLGEILEDYSVESNDVLRRLAVEGPKGLHQLAVAKGWDAPEAFADECDLCHGARRFLRSEYPDVLGPAECYPH